MSVRYIGKNLVRNKKRTVLLFFGLMIALALVTGVNIAGNQMISYQLESTINTVKVDYFLGTQDANTSKIQQNIAQLEGQIPEYLTSYHAMSQEIYYGKILKGNPINWSDYPNVTFENASKFFNSTNLLGLEPSFFNNPHIVNRLGNTIKFDTDVYDPSNGIYIDQKSAFRLNLTVGDNITFGEINFEYSSNSLNVQHTAQMSNIRIAGLFSCDDVRKFRQFFTGEAINNSYITSPYFEDSDIFLLCNFSYFHTIFTQVHVPTQTWLTGPLRTFGIIIDHSKLNLINTATLNTQITQIHTQIDLMSSNFEFEISSPLETMISATQGQSMMYQILFLAISIPIMMLGWYLSKTTYFLSYNNRRREIALLKTKGASMHQISVIFYGEAVIIGVLGGLTGLIGGLLSSNMILQKILPTISSSSPFTLEKFFSDLWTGKLIDQTTILLSVGLSVLISLISARDPIKQFIPLDPIEGLQKYHEGIQNTIAKKKSDWVWLFLGAFPLIFAFWINNPTNGNIVLYIFYSLFSSLGTALMPIAPFILLFALVKIFCERSINTFSKIVTFLTRAFSKPIALFTSKSILRNQARSARFVFLVALSLSFVVMTSTLAATEESYQKDLETVLNGNANRLLLKSSNLTQKGIQSYVNYISQYTSELGYQNVTSYCRSELVSIQGDADSSSMEYMNGFYNSYYPTSNVIDYFDLEVFLKLCPPKSDWILNDTVDQALMKLISIPNSTLVPEMMIEKGFRVNNTITIDYYAKDGSMKEIDLLIVGSYSVFPFDSMYIWQKRLIMDNRWFNDVAISGYHLLFYTKNESQIPITQIRNYFEIYDSSLTLDDYSIFESESQLQLFSIIATVIDFANLEKYYLIGMVTFGVGLIMYLSIHEKSHDIGILRARGIDKKSLYKMQLAEASVLLLLGTGFSIVGFLGAYGIMGQLNLMQFITLPLKRNLVIPWGSLTLNLFATFVLFIGVICVSIWKELKQSEVGPISDLLRI